MKKYKIKNQKFILDIHNYFKKNILNHVNKLYFDLQRLLYY